MILVRHADLFALQDDASALDIPTMRRWNLILRVFMAEYLNLQPSTSSRDVDDDAPRIQRSATELVSLGLVNEDAAKVILVACVIADFPMLNAADHYEVYLYHGTPGLTSGNAVSSPSTLGKLRGTCTSGDNSEGIALPSAKPEDSIIEQVDIDIPPWFNADGERTLRSPDCMASVALRKTLLCMVSVSDCDIDVKRLARAAAGSGESGERRGLPNWAC